MSGPAHYVPITKSLATRSLAERLAHAEATRDGWEEQIRKIRHDINMIPRIRSAVAREYQIEDVGQWGRTRHKETVEGRRVLVVLFRRNTSMSLPDIAQEMGKSRGAHAAVWDRYEDGLLNYGVMAMVEKIEKAYQITPFVPALTARRE